MHVTVQSPGWVSILLLLVGEQQSKVTFLFWFYCTVHSNTVYDTYCSVLKGGLGHRFILLEFMLGGGGHHVFCGEGLVVAFLAYQPVGSHHSFPLDTQTDRHRKVTE